jgi:predicted DNA-binding protein
MEKTEQIGVRISKEMKDQLKKLADLENRTLSGYIETILKNTVFENMPKQKK